MEDNYDQEILVFIPMPFDFDIADSRVNIR